MKFPFSAHNLLFLLRLSWTPFPLRYPVYTNDSSCHESPSSFFFILFFILYSLLHSLSPFNSLYIYPYTYPLTSHLYTGYPFFHVTIPTALTTWLHCRYLSSDNLRPGGGHSDSIQHLRTRSFVLTSNIQLYTSIHLFPIDTACTDRDAFSSKTTTATLVTT